MDVAVRTGQLMLLDVGESVGPLGADGVEGPATRAGLARFEAKRAAPPPSVSTPATARTAYAGFDTYAYPGDAAMAWLRANTNLVWVGAYIEAPSNSAKSYGTWEPAIPHLRQTGWGVAPIYVGQQVTGPGARTVTATQGAKDGADAAASMKRLGFAPGSCVFLDLENGAPLGSAQRAYVVAWASAVAAAGWLPGIYCSYQMAPAIGAAVPGARLWVFHVKTTTAHDVVAPYPEKLPSASGYAGAALWQHDDEAAIVIGPSGRRLQVDLDTAAMPDPSAPG